MPGLAASSLVFENIKLESVIKISGKVIKRSEDTVNKNLPTGEIEILSKKIGKKVGNHLSIVFRTF